MGAALSLLLSGIDVTPRRRIVAFDSASDVVLTTNSFNVAGSENHAINVAVCPVMPAPSRLPKRRVNLDGVFDVADILSVTSY
jgi:hypothetical protein